MRITCSLLIAALAMTVIPDSAKAGSGDYGRRSFKPFLTRDDTSVTVSLGVRQNNFDWNIASDLAGTATPNVLSELTWSDVQVTEVKTEFQHLEPANIGFIHGALQFDGAVSVGAAISGDNQDSDYAGDNRTAEFSRSYADSSAGLSFGSEASIGYRFIVSSREENRVYRDRYGYYRYRTRAPGMDISVTPLIGYSWTSQTYNDTNGVQVIPATGPFGGLDSEYTARWYGPYAGLEAELGGKKHKFKVRGEYHDLTYDAEAIWNLRNDFKQDPSFTHEADGDGMTVKAGYSYAVDSRYDFTIDALYQKRQAEDGIDTTYFSDDTITTIKLNEANDESQALRVGLRYHW